MIKLFLKWKNCDRMEIVVIDSSALITSSLFWECSTKKGRIILKQRKFSECVHLFDLFNRNRENLMCVITKTVEIEATSALKKAVGKLLAEKQWKIKNVIEKFNYSTLRNVIYDRSLDRMEDIIEEYSTRLPISKKGVKNIIKNEIEPFFRKIMPDTCRYFPAPEIIKRMRGSIEEKRQILDTIKDTISTGKILYIKGEPKEKDKIIMAEATYIFRTRKKREIFLAALDYHFIPNPKQIETYKSPLYLLDYDKIDTTVRDLLMKNFGFFSGRPKELIEIFGKMGIK